MRGVWLTVLFVAAAALTGCGSGKELPKVVPEATDKGASAAVVVPAKSEPAAVAVVERAVKAATDGNPARVERAKVNRLKLKGTVIGPTRPIPAVRTIEAVWPDRLVQSDSFEADSGLTAAQIRLRRPSLWVGQVAGGKSAAMELPDPKASEAAIAGEMVGRHWMALLVPLTDPKTVAFASRKEKLKDTPADVIRAAAPSTPVFTLWFDEATGRLLQVSFSHVEPGNRTETLKVFTLLNHRPADGLVLPGRIEYRQNGLPLEEWEVAGWEFPDRLDDASFDAPK